MIRLMGFHLVFLIVFSAFNVHGQEVERIMPLDEIIKVWSDNSINHDEKLNLFKKGNSYGGIVEIANVVVRKDDGQDIAFVTSKKWFNPRGGFPICYELSFKSKNIAEMKELEQGHNVEIKGRFTGYDLFDSGYVNICSTHIAIFENATIKNK